MSNINKNQNQFHIDEFDTISDITQADALLNEAARTLDMLGQQLGIQDSVSQKEAEKPPVYTEDVSYGYVTRNKGEERYFSQSQRGDTARENARKDGRRNGSGNYGSRGIDARGGNAQGYSSTSGIDAGADFGYEMLGEHRTKSAQARDAEFEELRARAAQAKYRAEHPEEFTDTSDTEEDAYAYDFDRLYEERHGRKKHFWQRGNAAKQDVSKGLLHADGSTIHASSNGRKKNKKKTAAKSPSKSQKHTFRYQEDQSQVGRSRSTKKKSYRSSRSTGRDEIRGARAHSTGSGQDHTFRYEQQDATRRHRRSTKQHQFPLPVRLLIGFAATIAMLALVLVTTWQVLNYVGQRRLYANAASETPELSALSEGETGENWQAGWVRYNGKVYEYNSNLLTFLIMGIDSEDVVKEAEDGISGNQADALFLLVADADAQQFSVVSINRNTMADLDVYDESGNYVGTGEGQICLQHGYGDGKEQSAMRQVNAVSRYLYNLPIHGYVAINMGAIPTINDAVGGVTVTVPEDLTFVSPNLVQGSTVTLMGQDAFWFVKARSTKIFDSASLRMQRQMQYISAFFSRLKNGVRENPALVLDIFNAITPYMVTNVDASEVTYLASNVTGYQFDSSRIYSVAGETVTGDDGFEEFYPEDGAWYDLLINVFYKEVRETE